MENTCGGLGVRDTCCFEVIVVSDKFASTSRNTPGWWMNVHMLRRLGGGHVRWSARREVVWLGVLCGAWEARWYVGKECDYIQDGRVHAEAVVVNPFPQLHTPTRTEDK